jgi:transposase
MFIVAEQYEFVIGVDTHAAIHTLSVITAATGAVIDQAVFSTTPSGLDRALTGITRCVDEHAALVVIEGVGSYGAGLTGRVVNAGLTVVEPASIAAARCR